MAKTKTNIISEEQMVAETAAQHEAAMDMANMLIAKQEEDAKEIEAQNQAERERLIAEAAKLTGRLEGLNATSKFVTVTTLMLLKQIKESKIYKEIQGIETWKNYCQSIGFSVEKVDTDLNNLETFGEDFLVTVTDFGIGYRQLRQLKKIKTDGALEIKEDTVIVDGEIIPLNDKDELKEALESLITSQQKALKEKDVKINQAEQELKTELDRKSKIIKEKEAAWAETDEIKKKLQEMSSAKLNPVPMEDLPQFNIIRKIEDEFSVIFLNISKLIDAKLSPLNQQMLAGVIGVMLRATDDARINLRSEYNLHIEGASVSDGEMERLSNLPTPNDYLETKNTK